jgi:hypothetical protein
MERKVCVLLSNLFCNKIRFIKSTDVCSTTFVFSRANQDKNLTNLEKLKKKYFKVH